MISPNRLEDLLATLGGLLEIRGHEYSLVTIGGGSLLLLGLSVRPTRDLDVIALAYPGEYRKADPLPAPLVDAAQDVGVAGGVGENWLNAGPASLVDLGLPPDLMKRAEVRRYGGLTLHIASRIDQIFFKLYAAVDQAPASKHLDDLRLLDPTADELIEAARWSITHDPSEGYRTQLVSLLRTLGVPNAGPQL